MPQFEAPNGEMIVGVLERVPCVVQIDDISEDGTYVLPTVGVSNTIWWDDQEPVMKGESLVFIDEESGQWTFDQLTKVVEEDEDDSTEEEAVEKIEVMPAERDIILAALHFYTLKRLNGTDFPDEVVEIATNGGAHEILSYEAINELCERINT